MLCDYKVFAAAAARRTNDGRGVGKSWQLFSSFFVYTPPRFHFNRSEQLLLHHALMGETSDDLAASLSISPWTVKKRWQAIYDRVADVDRDLLLPPVANGAHVSARGAERRRRLLHYLRQHFEELRPFGYLYGFGRTYLSAMRRRFRPTPSANRRTATGGLTASDAKVLQIGSRGCLTSDFHARQ